MRVASKVFTEGVILGDIVTGLLRDAGIRASHRRELGGTRVLWSALLAGDIDAYVEYSGTLSAEILPGVAAGDRDDLLEALRQRGVLVGADLGFDNTYAIGMLEARAAQLRIATLSDLRAHGELRFGFSNEFLDRGDGWPALREAYGLPQQVRGLDHDVAYRALAAGEIDATDLYSTDAEIAYYGLRVLADDRGHFPEYRALVLYRADLRDRVPEVAAALARLQGGVDALRMAQMNAAVKVQRRSEGEVAAAFLRERLGIDVDSAPSGLLRDVSRRAGEHLLLVALSLSGAVAIAVPLGIAGARAPRAGGVLLAVAGVIQTVPSLALLVFMVPLLGIGELPAIAALFLYSLLPVLRNTVVGLASIPPDLLESADALGLPRAARLRLVELPLASPAILAGIKTAAVINVGTATLGALIGAGGFGQPILTGIRLDDTALILQGAVPAALLAIGVQFVFAGIERLLVPRGLRG